MLIPNFKNQKHVHGLGPELRSGINPPSWLGGSMVKRAMDMLLLFRVIA